MSYHSAQYVTPNPLWYGKIIKTPAAVTTEEISKAASRHEWRKCNVGSLLTEARSN
jgi:hypothetical protein